MQERDRFKSLTKRLHLGSYSASDQLSIMASLQMSSFAVAALALQLCTAEETTPTPQPTNADGDADLVLGLPLGTSMLIVLIIIAAVCLCQICQTFGTKKKRQCVWEFCCLDGDAYAARRIASAHAEGKGKWNSGSKASGTAGASPMHRTEIRDPEIPPHI